MTATVPRPVPARPALGAAAVLPLAALAWSAVAILAAVLWSTGAIEYPFDVPPGLVPLAFIGFAPQLLVTTAAILLGVVGSALAIRMTAGWAGTSRDPLPVAFAGLLLVLVVTLVADANLMAYLGYSLSFRFPPITPEVAGQGLAVLGALVWFAAALAWERRGRLPFRREGRPPSTLAVVAVGIALVVPLVYAVTRFAWAVGIPFGIDDEMLADGQASGLWLIGLGLGLVATGGGLLALGLVQRWGERIPGRVPVLGGRGVPVPLAVIPAAIAAASITGAGLGFVRVVVSGELSLEGNWVTVGPELLWPLWGVALAVATVAYARRRIEWRLPSVGAT